MARIPCDFIVRILPLSHLTTHPLTSSSPSPSIVYSAIYACGPGRKPSYDGSWPTPLRHWSLWSAMASYFPQAALHKTADLDPSKVYIFGQHPHGVLAFGTWLGFGCEALGFSRLFPGIDVRVSTLNINFRAPVLREYLLLHGVCSVSKEAILTLLRGGKSVTITVGGGSESLLTRPGHHDLILNRRKGFVRCAVQTGASLVPVILFGENNTYSTINSLPPNSPLRRFQSWLEKRLGFTIPIAFGAGVFTRWGLLPHPVPLNVVVGAPIEVEKWVEVNGDDEQEQEQGARFDAVVDKYHRLYMDALQKLFDENKEKYAKNEADMVLVE